MRALSKIFWILAFLAATFVWMVIFEHGVSARAIVDGSRQEWRRLVDSLFSAPESSTPPADEKTGESSP